MRYKVKLNSPDNPYYLTTFRKYLVIDRKTQKPPVSFNIRWFAGLYTFVLNIIFD